MLNGPLQIVPDVDDEKNDANKANVIVPLPEGQSEFERKLEQARMESSETIPKQRKFILHRRKPGAQPPIRRLSHDAQPVSSDPRYQRSNPFIASWRQLNGVWMENILGQLTVWERWIYVMLMVCEWSLAVFEW